jgi:hypothetical protein
MNKTLPLFLAALALALNASAAASVSYVNAGSGANTHDGDPLRSAFIKINTNFLNLSAGQIGGAKMLSPEAGNDAIADKNAGTADFSGQMGVSFYNNKNPYLWFASSPGTGSNSWRGWPILASGMPYIGSEFSMPARPTDGGGMRFFMNGNPIDASSNLWTVKNGSCLFINNMNPFSDGNFVCLPMYSTNAGGTLIGALAQGGNLYRVNDFGNQFGTIPETYFVGETNQAGSYVWLTQPGFPTYISCNMTLPGESGGFYSQHAWAAFDARSVSTTANDKKLGVHFPIQVPYCWHYTNSLWKDALMIDEKFGSCYFGSNVYVSGDLMITNQSGSAKLVVGPDFDDIVNQPSIHFWCMTNAHFGGLAAQSGAYTFDCESAGAGYYRMGFVVQSGSYPALCHASGTPFTISRSSSTSLQTTPISGQTLTAEETIDSSGNAVFSGTLTATTLTGSGSGLTNVATQFYAGTSGNTTLAAGTTYFFQPHNSSATLPTADASAGTRELVTKTTTLANLYVVQSAAPGVGKNYTYTIMTNGVATNISVASGNATTGNDTTHSVIVLAGTEVGIRVVTDAAATVAKASWAFQGK